MSALVVLASVSVLRFITTTVASSAFDWKVEPVLLQRPATANLGTFICLSPWCQQKKTLLKCFRDLTYQSLIFQFPIYLEYLGFFSSPDHFATPKGCNKKNPEGTWKISGKICVRFFWPPILMEFSKTRSGSSDDGTNCFSNPSTWS